MPRLGAGDALPKPASQALTWLAAVRNVLGGRAFETSAIVLLAHLAMSSKTVRFAASFSTRFSDTDQTADVTASALWQRSTRRVRDTACSCTLRACSLEYAPAVLAAFLMLARRARREAGGPVLH